MTPTRIVMLLNDKGVRMVGFFVSETGKMLRLARRWDSAAYQVFDTPLSSIRERQEWLTAEAPNGDPIDG